MIADVNELESRAWIAAVRLVGGGTRAKRIVIHVETYVCNSRVLECGSASG